MSRDAEIRAKLARLEALFARGATEGERAAAGAALDRLQARLGADAPADAPETEMQYTFPDSWPPTLGQRGSSWRSAASMACVPTAIPVSAARR